MYFERLVVLAKKHSRQKIYRDFITLFDKTGTAIDNMVLEWIKIISKPYGEDRIEIRKWFTVMYAAMVAEENKAHPKLGKRIKRLGVYQVLILQKSVLHVVNYSRGRKWYELDEVMKWYGF
jgi:hypothetical protein